MYSLHRQVDSDVADGAVKRALAVRLLIFVGVLVGVAGAGLVWDYSRPAVYRATSRLAVEPPGTTDEIAKSQFALNEAQAMRRSELIQSVAARLEASSTGKRMDGAELERLLSVEHVPQTSVIELRAEGHDRLQLVNFLSAWTEAYIRSRKHTDREDEATLLEEAKHATSVAQKAVATKQQEIDAFRKQHGIVSVEREENQGAARLKGVHTALNEAADGEVKAEARLKAVQDGLDQGRGVIRASDKPAIANLEMRAVDLREKIKDLEHDFTPHFLAMEPKYKALKANLARVEQQIEQEKQRSQKAALLEAQENLAGAQRATQKIREQANSLKAESQAFSARFVELKRMGVDLEQLQEARRVARERQAQLETAFKPSEVRIRVLSSASASESPIAPDYSRDAAIALAAGLALALIAVWMHDYLRRAPHAQDTQSASPIIQIAYPMLQTPGDVAGARRLATGSAGGALLGVSPTTGLARELTQADVSALWAAAPADERLVIAATLNGIGPSELTALCWKHVDLEHGSIRIPGASARSLALVDPLCAELRSRLTVVSDDSSERPLFADGAGDALDEAAVDSQLACVAHDAGLRQPTEITVRSLHFTYAAYLARQGMRMVDLVATVGRVNGVVSAELMRLAPPNVAALAERIDRVYPGFRVSEPGTGARPAPSTSPEAA